MARRQADRARGPSDLSRQGVSTEGADPSRRLFVYSAYLEKRGPDCTTTRVRVGYQVARSEDEVRGIAFRRCKEENADPDFAVVDLTILEVPPELIVDLARDTDRSGEAGQTAQQAGPKARAGAEGIAEMLSVLPMPSPKPGRPGYKQGRGD